MLEAGGGRTPALFRLNSSASPLLSGKDSQPVLLTRERIALRTREFCKHLGRSQNGAFARALILRATETNKKGFAASVAEKTPNPLKPLASSTIIHQPSQDIEVGYSKVWGLEPVGWGTAQQHSRS